MVSKRKYPKLVIDLSKLRNNIEKVRIMCQDKGVEIAGVIKGCTGDSGMRRAV